MICHNVTWSGRWDWQATDLSTQRWRMTPGDKPDLPAVEAWFARLERRAGFAQHVDNGVP